MSQIEEEVSSPPNFWVRLIPFLFFAVVALIFLNVGLSALNTLRQLDVIEAGRDNWQHPLQVIQALNMKSGNSVVDLGCGSGYFSLRLSDQLGTSGRVIAEDVRRLPLAFLWIRAARKGKHNVSVHLGDYDDPRLPPNSVNAVLISNTYHEFGAPLSILSHLRQALLPGGKLVIIDRTPRPNNGLTPIQKHEVSFKQVERDLRESGFAIDERTENFIERDPENESWWMIVARQP